jgi:hypothetical protein
MSHRNDLHSGAQSLQDGRPSAASPGALLAVAGLASRTLGYLQIMALVRGASSR